MADNKAPAVPHAGPGDARAADAAETLRPGPGLGRQALSFPGPVGLAGLARRRGEDGLPGARSRFLRARKAKEVQDHFGSSVQ